MPHYDANTNYRRILTPGDLNWAQHLVCQIGPCTDTNRIEHVIEFEAILLGSPREKRKRMLRRLTLLLCMSCVVSCVILTVFLRYHILNNKGRY